MGWVGLRYDENGFIRLKPETFVVGLKTVF